MIILVFALVLLVPASALAWDSGDLAEFAGGWVAGLAAHEAGHYAVGAQSGADVEFTGMDNGSPSLWIEGDRGAVRNTAAGGFMVQIASTEVILEREEKGSFLLGWLGYNIVNAVSYTLRDQLSPNGHGDLATMGEHGASSDMAGVVLVTHAAWSAYRLAGGPDGGAEPWVVADPIHKTYALGFRWRW
jgi:hypothetical protein